ncbi:hypothetical protein G7K_1262-t1 [Saitoella complicata NRRL Y-17804]|uniref:Uncharacterized protein n=1 Tax=Saitoella complicata (strain BCRC 22490 / CBS 7301 / JCM 7358 / NBRC 10748 / NRRL Y-17804) TaxID=698492 RepID=A0A0E9NB33_SAICN|nr:hypothetical protein G7K_1262-t1 [Saitoella complicata NRRL Y-17804]
MEDMRHIIAVHLHVPLNSLVIAKAKSKAKRRARRNGIPIIKQSKWSISRMKAPECSTYIRCTPKSAQIPSQKVR